MKIIHLALLSLSLTSCQHGSTFDREVAKREISNDARSCMQLMSTFYNNQNMERITSRIEATKYDAHKFLRSFPPYYYKLAEDLNLRSILGDVYQYRSVIAGDPHVENFGVRSFNGELRILINDFDDLSEGNTILDVVRLLTSMKLSGHKVDKKFTEKFIKRYVEGLELKKEKYSKVTEKFFKEAKKNKPRVATKKYDPKTKKFLSKREPAEDVEVSDFEFLKEAFKPFGEVRDAYKYVKEGGGSGGLDRFELLIEKEGEFIWVEVKEWDTPGINAGLLTTPPSHQKRLEYVLKYDQPELPISTINFQGKIFQVREVSERHVDITLDNIKKSDIENLYLDLAYALGRFHHTFDVNEKYIASLSETKSDDIHEAVKKVTSSIEEVVEKLENTKE